MNKINCPFGTATLTFYPCKNGNAVIICPGGGYSFTSEREAEPVAKAYQAAGFAAFVLEYDCFSGTPLDTLPLRQLAWAVSTVRENAAAFECTQKIAVCGFSAGAHLAASLGVFWQDDERFDDNTTPLSREPNALILSYPVITAGPFMHKNSLMRLAGENKEQQMRWSLENFVTSKVPPVFLWHTLDDPSVPVENTWLFSKALRKYNVSHEVHLFCHGPHGLSLATEEVSRKEKGDLAYPHIAHWFELAVEWLELLEG